MKGIVTATARLLALALVLATMPALAQDAAEETETVNINTASADALADALHGVGPAKADAIVTWREEQGEFTTPEHLEEVDGIGPATISDNREKIRLD
ncbi:ComEA family DNA-binding protein [Vreelandella utahensis]|uniref:ComEA family DNA-binding protein n=1 Tax=Vreelandella halophila TaxID=86177 RepID=UPI0009843BB5|nr:helix-hairpin-helix domain-containing protein [Halomonas utahensis]